MDIIELIKKVPLFKGLSTDNYENLANIAQNRLINRSVIIFFDGSESSGFYILVSGRVKIFKLSPEGKEQILGIIEPLEPFGEVPVFCDTSFPASAEAMVESRILFFSRMDFVRLIKKDTSLALNILSILSQRQKKFTILVEQLTLRDVSARLSAYLLCLSEKKGGASDLELDISKNQLAGLLGTIPETLSRTLSKMAKKELIRIKGRRLISILNKKSIERLARGEKLISRIL